MQLERNTQTRAQLWNRKARGATWELIMYFPVTSRKDPAIITEIRYKLTYEAMIKFYDTLAYGVVNEIPEYGKFTADITELKYANNRRPYKRGRYDGYKCSNYVDKRKAIVDLLELQTKVLPTAIKLERLV